MRRLALAAGLAATLALAAASPAAAIETGEFGIEPVARGAPRQSFHEQLRAGRTTRDAVRVFNKANHPVTVRLWAEQASIDADGQVRLGGVGGAANWIKIPTSVVELGPKSERSVPFEVRAPRQIPAGTASIALLAEPVAQQPARVAVLQRLAVLVYAEPHDGAPLRAALGWPLAAAAVLLGLVAAAAAAFARRRGRAGSEGSGFASRVRVGAGRGPVAS